MAIKKVSLSWITVSNIEKAKQFFIESCGLEMTHGSSLEHGWLELLGQEGGMTLGVARACPTMQIRAGENAVVTLLVDDIVATKQEMEKKGVIFIGDIMEVPGHIKLATFVDPDNNTFQLAQELSSKKCC